MSLPSGPDRIAQNQGQVLHPDPTLLHLTAWEVAGCMLSPEAAPCEYETLLLSGTLPGGRFTPPNGKGFQIEAQIEPGLAPAPKILH